MTLDQFGRTCLLIHRLGLALVVACCVAAGGLWLAHAGESAWTYWRFAFVAVVTIAVLPIALLHGQLGAWAEDADKKLTDLLESKSDSKAK